MELTVESLIAELGLELASGHEAAQAHVRWVHSSELLDPTPWLRGGELLLSTTARPVRDARGRRRGALVLLEDVTERRRDEARLRQTA